MIYLAGYSKLNAENDGKIDRKFLADIKKQCGMRRADAYTAMLTAVARQAAADSPFEGKTPEDTGIIVASEYGPMNTVAAFLDELRSFPEDQLLSTAFSHSVHNAAASYAAMHLHITGPELTQTGFENLRAEAFANAEAFLETGYATRVFVLFALEHGYITDFMKQTQQIPPEYAEAFLLTKYKDEGKHGTFFPATHSPPQRRERNDMSELSLQEIVTALKEEIAVITGRKTENLKAEESLSFNGINSMGFVELLLSINRIWQVNLMEAGIGIGDVRTLNALAEKIKQEAEK